MKPKSDTTKQPLEEGKKYHIDCEFEGERLVDDVEILITPKSIEKKVFVYSKKLMANIEIPKKELKEIAPDSKEGLHTQDDWFISGGMVDGYEIRTKSGKVIVSPHTTYPVSHEDAELIVRAVNERKALLDKINELEEYTEYVSYQISMDDNILTFQQWLDAGKPESD